MLEVIGLPCMASVVSSGVLTSAKVWQRTYAMKAACFAQEAPMQAWSLTEMSHSLLRLLQVSWMPSGRPAWPWRPSCRQSPRTSEPWRRG